VGTRSGARVSLPPALVARPLCGTGIRLRPARNSFVVLQFSELSHNVHRSGVKINISQAESQQLTPAQASERITSARNEVASAQLAATPDLLTPSAAPMSAPCRTPASGGDSRGATGHPVLPCSRSLAAGGRTSPRLIPNDPDAEIGAPRARRRGRNTIQRQVTEPRHDVQPQRHGVQFAPPRLQRPIRDPVGGGDLGGGWRSSRSTGVL
jgi:hypothetical protein